jgi:hypothetical protein
MQIRESTEQKPISLVGKMVGQIWVLITKHLFGFVTMSDSHAPVHLSQVNEVLREKHFNNHRCRYFTVTPPDVTDIALALSITLGIPELFVSHDTNELYRQNITPPMGYFLYIPYSV